MASLVSLPFISMIAVKFQIKPGTYPQPAKGRLWACAWFTEIVFVCIYLSMFVCTHPREQILLVVWIWI